MLEVRKEQMDVFAKIASQQFEDSMVEYIREAFPRAYDELKEPKIREIIRFGWDKAKSYGLKSERGVRLYVSLTFLIGGSFDTDPQLPWAEKILKDETMADEDEKNNRLYDESMDYYYEVMGAEGENFDAALRAVQYENIKELSIYEIKQGAPLERFQYQMNPRLKRIFPQKYEYLKEDGIGKLIQLGIESAKNYGITTERGLTIYISIMYILGSGFDTDLKYPWVTEILKDEEITEQVQRIDRLYAKAMELLEKRFS